MNSEHDVQLPDGRVVRAIQPAEAHVIWRSMVKEGLYGKAKRQLRSGDTVLDVGGHVGLAAMYFAEARPELQIISVEAAPRTYACLRANLARHVPNAVAIHSAVAGACGRRTFTFYENSPGNSGLHANPTLDNSTSRIFLANSGIDDETIHDILFDLHEPTEIDVEATTVSAVIDQYGVTAVGLLKIDVERAELEVAQGVADRHWPLIRYVVAEVHAEGGRLDALRTLLESKGFKVSVSQDPSLRGTELYDLDAERP